MIRRILPALIVNTTVLLVLVVTVLLSAPLSDVAPNGAGTTAPSAVQVVNTDVTAEDEAPRVCVKEKQPA